MNDFIAQQGWQCPLCKRVYSPSTPLCWYCGGEGTIKTSTEGTIKTSTDWVKHESTTGTPPLDIGGYTISYPLNREENKEEDNEIR